MCKPKGEWDRTAFLQVGSEVVLLNNEIARQINLSVGEDEQDVRASAAVERYFGGDFMNRAPRTVIQSSQERVELSMEQVVGPTEEAAKILAAARE